jgi:hypothetical protein
MEEGQTAVKREKWNTFAIAGAIAAAAAFLWWPLMGWIAPYPTPTVPLADGTPMFEYYSGLAAMALVFDLVAIVLIALALAETRRQRRGTRSFGTLGGVLILVVLIGAMRACGMPIV